jgi:GDP-L-fucose synthase
MEKRSRIYIAGHRGLIGSAVLRCLERVGYQNLIVAGREHLDLTETSAVDLFFSEYQPEYVVLAAGRVGGIIENSEFPADFMNENLAIQLNVFRAAHRENVKKLIYFASSCMYPRECSQPMQESALLTGLPEPTSMAYALSKLAGMQMCLSYNQQYGKQSFIPVIPNSAFGPNDNFDPQSGHVLSALISRFYEAKKNGAESVTLWGSGKPRREFVHADDIAEASLLLLCNDTSELVLPLNLGSGFDLTIRELAEKISDLVGYHGKIIWNTNKPDGAPLKLLDSSRLREFGWKPKFDFETRLKNTYSWYVDQAETLKTLI